MTGAARRDTEEKHIMQVGEIHEHLRRVERGDYPELDGLSRSDIFDGNMGIGALYHMVHMTRTAGAKAGDVVMDLGCGNGRSSVFLAEHLAVRVVAVDLWIDPAELHRKFQERGVADRVIPLRLDITEPLPFAEDYFDAIFCMGAIHYFGANAGFMTHLLKHLRPGGRLSIGNTCFNREFTPEELENLPGFCGGNEDLWSSEFSKYHSPEWWGSLLEETGLVDVVECRELEDGAAMWDEELHYRLTEKIPPAGGERALADFAQIAYGRENEPYLTNFVLTAQKRAGA